MVNFRIFDHVGPGFGNNIKINPNIKQGLNTLKDSLGTVGDAAGSAISSTGLDGGLLDKLKESSVHRGRPSRPGLLDKYIGMAQYPIKDGVSMDYDTEASQFPRPRWIEMFNEEPGDSSGALLALVQLVETNGRTIPDKLPHPIPPELSILPRSREAWIEMILSLIHI